MSVINTAARMSENVWCEVRYRVGYGITGIGDLITRLGEQVAAPGLWLGRGEQAYGEGFQFAMEMARKAEQAAAKV